MSLGVQTVEEIGWTFDRSSHSPHVPLSRTSAHFRSTSGFILSSARRCGPILPIDSDHEVGGRSHLTLWGTIRWAKKFA
jgi:hypothetical protein